MVVLSPRVYTDALTNETQDNPFTTLPYCQNPPHYIYDFDNVRQRYINNNCSENLFLQEFVDLTLQSVKVGTYFRKAR